MLTGKLPFRGEHEAAMVYSIVNEEPQDIALLKPGLSPLVTGLIQRCLEKDPEDRYQTMQDAVSELRRSLKKTTGTLRKSMGPTEFPGANRRDSNQPVQSSWKQSPLFLPLIGAIGAMVILLGVMSVLLSAEDAPPTLVGPETRVYRFTSMPGLEDNPSWSPDGKFLAYETDENGQMDIVIQPADGGNPARVLDSRANEAQAAWSPDGSMLAFVSSRDHGGFFSSLLGFGSLNLYLDGGGGTIFLVKAFGGEPLKLVSDGFDPAWSPDGKEIVFRSARDGQWDLWKVSTGGGEPQRITNDPNLDFQPSWSPDGRWIVFGSSAGGGVGSELFAISPEGGTRRALTADAALVLSPRFIENGAALIFSSSRGGTVNLWRIPFLPESEGYAHPVRVTAGQGDDVNITLTQNQEKAAFAAVTSAPDIWELNIGTGALRRITSENGLENHVAPSPDGSQFALHSDRGGKSAIWIVGSDGSFKRLLSTGAGFPRWSPDGKQILHNNLSGSIEIRSIGELSASTVILNASIGSWSPSGTKIAFARPEGETQQNIWIYDFTTRREEKLTSLVGFAIFPVWSRDGSKIAFTIDVGDDRHLMVVSSSGGTPERVPTDNAEYSHPSWSPLDDDLLLCVRDHHDLVAVSSSTGRFRYLKKFEESAIRLTDYPAWSPDGKKVYFDQVRKTGDIYVVEK